MRSTNEKTIAQRDFEKHFGPTDDIRVYDDYMAGEQVIIVENRFRKAIYSMNAELLKVINLTSEG